MDHHMTRVVMEGSIPAQGTANTAQDNNLGACPIGGTVTDAAIIPEAAVVGNATNFRNFRLVNKGQSGSGNTVIATFATSATPANDLAAFDERKLTINSANAKVTEGDVLVADETVAAAGVAHAGYRITVEIEK